MEGVVTAGSADGARLWRGRSVLVTGHTGFKGAWLCLWLHARGAHVTGLGLPPSTSPNLFDAARVAEVTTSLVGDVRDPVTVARAIERARPEVVLHLAAQSLVGVGYTDPLGTFSTNVMGTAVLLDAIRRCPEPTPRAVVCVTSDKCYDNREWPWGYRETDAMGGHDPYSASKGCAELVTAAFRRSYLSAPGAPLVASARAGNVIGGGDWSADRLLPDLARAFASGDEAVVRRPAAVRPWQHVLEPLGAYLLLAERLMAGDPSVADGWNFGPPTADAWPVRDVVAAAASQWGPAAAWRTVADPAAGRHEAGQLRLDCSKAMSLLGWQPQLALAEAIAWTVDWYRAHAEGAEAAELCRAQIDRYEERVSAPANRSSCSA